MSYLFVGLIAALEVPPLVTLACACACAYLIGKVPSTLKGNALPEVTETPVSDEKRANKLVDRLTHEFENFHNDLTMYEESLRKLQRAIVWVYESSDEGSVSIEDETRQALRSIERLANEIPLAFDSIRQTTTAAVDSLMPESSDGSTDKDAADLQRA